MSRKAILLVIVLLAASWSCLNAQQPKEFKQALDSIQVLMKERTTVTGLVKANKVVPRGDALDFYFTTSFGDYPWRNSDVKWFRTTLKILLPDEWKSKTIGDLYVGKNKVESYIMPVAGKSGKPSSAMFRTKDRRGQPRFISKVGGQDFPKGLSGRTIALWQSHGRYYEEKKERWEWQRAPLFQTVEDMYTQSYVLPFLIPMLENAGAYVMTPRER
ncbi:MAG: hypothetical protein IK076_07855, partial [Bacteroidales bacterium]|nr:hypothetical protein [Bacteroidales bacterium]